MAEKLHAYTRVYEGGRVNSRAKDLVDLALIASLFAIETTFAARGTQESPRAVPPPPDQWRAPFGQRARAVGMDDGLDTGHHAVAAMLGPILDHHVRAGMWNPEVKRWTDITTS